MSIEKRGKFVESIRYALPVFFPLTALLAGFVLWGTYCGSLPGSGLRFWGYAAEVAFWTSLYAGLGYVYIRALRIEGMPLRDILGRLGFSLFLAFASTHVVMLLLAPAIWDKLFYLRYISPVALAGLWCLALLPRETAEIRRIIVTSKSDAHLPQIASMLFASGFLVSCSDLAFQFGASPGTAIQNSLIGKNAWLTNTTILFAFYAAAFTITSRLQSTLLLVSPVYVVLGIANLVKLKYMHAAVSPLDLLSIPEFLPQFKTFFGYGVLLFAVGVSVAWVGALVLVRRVRPYRISFVYRLGLMVLSVAVISTVPAIYFFYPPGFQSSRERLYRAIGSPEHHVTREFARESGYLLSFLSEIPSSFAVAPSKYSRETVAAVWRKYERQERTASEEDQGMKVNLIVYMIESFMDPEDLGWSYTSDPIPNFRFLRKAGIGGHAIVPERFGGSINSEFEALTGMTCSFLPARSLAFRQFVKCPVPSLPSMLKQMGYRTVAIQADPRDWFNRERVYDLLGFEEVVWLHEWKGVERASPGSWPSDGAVVESIIQRSNEGGPFFIFAFPSATHAPYVAGSYESSDLDVRNPPPGEAGRELKGYINALRTSDQAIGTLVEHFRRQPFPTIIAVVGDHLPPISSEAYRLFDGNMSGVSEAERDFRSRRVPLLLWSNLQIERKETEISLNALPALLLEHMKIPPRGFIALSDAVRKKLPVVSRYFKGVDSSVRDRKSLPAEADALVEEYRLLQHDVLRGKRYSLNE